jgi:hypothetical protein
MGPIVDFGSVLLFFGEVYVTAYLAGYNLESFCQWHYFESQPFMVKTALRACLGTAVLIPILYAISLVTVSAAEFDLLFVGNLSLFLVNIYDLRGARLLLRKLVSPVNLSAIVLGSLIVAFFVHSVTVAQWPEPGDIAWVHGPLVSLILYDGKLPTSWFPITNLPLHYPPGFHIIPASFDTSWGIYPGQAVLIYGASILPLLTLLIYSLVWIITESVMASIAGALSVLYVMPGRADTWAVGYFYNGPYPNLLAFLIVVFFCGVLLTRDQQKVERSSNSPVPLIGILCTLSLFLAYPPFAVFPAVGTLLTCIFGNGGLQGIAAGLRQRALEIVGATAFVIVTFGLLITDPTWSIDWTLGRVIQNTSGYSPLPITTFTFSWFGISIVAASAIAMFDLIYRRFWRFSLQYAVIVTSAFAFYFAPILVLILPNRSFALSFIMAPVLLLSLATSLQRKFPRLEVSFLKTRVRLGVLVAAILLLIVCSPSLYMYANATVEQHAWFPQSPSFTDDFNSMKWLSANVPADALILNDLSYASLYLPSLRVFNLSFAPISANGQTGNSRVELFDVWQNPMGYYPAQPLPLFASAWTLENPWGNGNIGRPTLSQYNSSLQLAIPSGTFGQWGLHDNYSTPENFTQFAALTAEISSSRSIGVSIGLQDTLGRVARYDMVTNGSSSQMFDLALAQPSNLQQGFQRDHVAMIWIRTGYATPFPLAGDSVTVQQIGVRPNSNMVKDLLLKYNVRYVWVSEEWGMVPLSSFAGFPGYVSKPETPYTYTSIFKSYNFLNLAYFSANSSIFEVNL